MQIDDSPKHATNHSMQAQAQAQAQHCSYSSVQLRSSGLVLYVRGDFLMCDRIMFVEFIGTSTDTFLTR